jgi:hypothetical protein
LSRQIFKENLAEDEKKDNLQERENKRSSGNNLKAPKKQPKYDKFRHTNSVKILVESC